MKKSWPFLLAFLITAALGGLALAIWLLAGGATWLSPLPTMIAPAQAQGVPGFTPIPWADVTLTPSPFNFTATPSPTGDKKTPKFVPTKVPQWISEKLPLYSWNVELAPGWTAHEINRRPEPKGQEWLEHDCADYQLSSQDKTEFIIIKMPCGGYDGQMGGSCGPNTTFIQSVDNNKYFIRYPHPQHVGYVYEISGQWTWEDLSGSHTEWACGDPLKFGYYYWQDGHTMLDYIPGPEIDRMVLYMLTNNDFLPPNP
jgi:hypothetical protein